jgi:multicomponent Na+:H+ antiporter subunit F
LTLGGGSVLAGLLVAAATFLLLNVLVGLARVLLGPATPDRLLGVILLGTTGVALLAVLAEVTGLPALRDTALALVALAALVVVVRVRAEERRP